MNADSTVHTHSEAYGYDSAWRAVYAALWLYKCVSGRQNGLLASVDRLVVWGLSARHIA